MLIAKLLATIKIAIHNFLVYRINFLLEVCAPVLAFFFIRYNIWLAIYGGHDSQLVFHGYSLQDMLNFQCWSMFVELIVYSFNGQNMATEIRLGRISSFLLYPVSFNFYQFGKFLGVIIIQILIAIFSIFIFYLTGMLNSISIMAVIVGIFFCFLSATIWYLINYISGVMAFWMEETWFLRVTVTLVCRLIGGAIMPVEFFPEWLRLITVFTPFTYMIFYPIKILQGDFNNIISIFLIILAWCGIFAILASRLWRIGVRSYTAAGA